MIDARGGGEEEPSLKRRKNNRRESSSSESGGYYWGGTADGMLMVGRIFLCLWRTSSFGEDESGHHGGAMELGTMISRRNPQEFLVRCGGRGRAGTG